MNDDYTRQMAASSHLSGASSAYIDGLYEDYLQNPDSVPEQWRDYFSQLPQVNGATHDISHAAIREQFLAQAKQGPRARVAVPGDVQHERKQVHVSQLIDAYRAHGHLQAQLDPLHMSERKHLADLELSSHDLSEQDFDMQFSTDSAIVQQQATLREIVSGLQQTYCESIGIEYMHISDPTEVQWFQQRFESQRGKGEFSTEDKREILQHLTAAEGMEKYLGTRYVGQKRFSLEGGDSFIPMVKECIKRSGAQGVKEIVIGMAHRGRLNMLVNALGKAPEELFLEFEGKVAASEEMSGDVKYHMGFSSDINTAGGVVHLAMSFNPSHLEIISPVVQGSVRSRQRRRHDLDDKKLVLPLVVHGDAAFAGQGVVMETFNFSQARGYSTGGTIHIVINNQVGFTTSNPLDSRSTLYCTDVAKMVAAPVIHVNGNDPEACVYAMQLAIDYRMRFKRDVVIDLVCYRRHGHNEADEPSMTQPKMYDIIRKMPTTREMYAQQLIAEDVVSQKDVDGFVFNYRDALDKGEPVVDTVTNEYKKSYLVDWTKFLDKHWREEAESGYELKALKELGKRLTVLPKGFDCHPVVKKLLQERAKMAAGDVPVNWGMAENLAYATLVCEGHPVRLSGQDCGRGTFAHRHAVIHEYRNGESFMPLQHLSPDQAAILVIDSVLSEEAVLAFEYGYAASEPNALIIWEAQFGDFANGAQVVIDQFISSGEQKWGRLCGLVMLLPHGYEGQGPEHSSARLERYLQLCAQHNMQVCVPTTPAQTFHMLRRQILRPYRKPLVVMTPKSLLRHKLAVSTLDELANGEFQVIIPEIDDIDAQKTRRVVLCSGKVYYELLQQRRENEQDDIAIIRIEQLYPFPIRELHEILKPYEHVKDIVWCQEEPKNQGAWYPSSHNMRLSLHKGQKLRYVGRGHLASPAAGYSKIHQQRQRKLVNEALEK